MKRLILALALAVTVWAVGYERPAHAQDESELVVRLSRLEAQVRTLSGQVEQLQFDNRQLQDRLKRFQEDVEFRFQDKGGARPTPGAPVRQILPSAPPAAPARRSDAFDPAAEPGAPGAPQALGAPGAPLPPPALRQGGRMPPAEEADQFGGPGTPLDLQGVTAPPAVAQALPRQPPPVATGTDSARQDYDSAYVAFQQKHYEQAEMGFRSFLQSYPKSKLVPDATYWLGESYLLRQKYREAAERFLKITTDYASSSKGAEGMYKLGLSLRGLGAGDQACATLAEVVKKYPNASAGLKRNVERERQRARCPA